MSRYYEVRKRISTEKSPLSDAEIIESLDREIEEYRDGIVRMEDKLRKRDITEALMSEEMKALKNENKGLSEELDKLKKENEELSRRVIPNEFVVHADGMTIRYSADQLPKIEFEGTISRCDY